MHVEVGGEKIPVEYANNIWTEARSSSVIVTVALIVLLAIGGFYAIYPLEGLGFSQIGSWMLTGAAALTIVQIALIVAWTQLNRPTFQGDKHTFAKLDRFQDHEKGFDFAGFVDKGSAFMAYFLKDGARKRFVILRDNEIAAEFFDNVRQTYEWVTLGPH